MGEREGVLEGERAPQHARYEVVVYVLLHADTHRRESGNFLPSDEHSRHREWGDGPGSYKWQAEVNSGARRSYLDLLIGPFLSGGARLCDSRCSMRARTACDGRLFDQEHGGST